MSGYCRITRTCIVGVQVALVSMVFAANDAQGERPAWCVSGVVEAQAGTNADMLLGEAIVLDERGNYAVALRSLCAAFVMSEAQGQSQLAGRMANYAGTILFRSHGDLDAAISAFRAAIKLADPVRHASEAATAYANLANAYFRKGFLDDSQQQLATATRLAAGIISAAQRHTTLGSIAIKQGLLAEAAGTLDRAVNYYESAREHAEAVPAEAPLPIRRSAAQVYVEALHNLAAIEISRGNHAAAIRMLMPLRGWAHEHQMPVAEAWITFSLLMAFQGVNQHRQVLALYPGLQALQKTTPDASLMASVDMAISQSYYRLGQMDDAKRALLRAAQFFGEQRMVNELAQALNALGGLTLAQGRPADAERAFIDALKGRRVINDRVGEGITLSALANLAWRSNDVDRAIALLKQAVAILKEAPEPLVYARTLGSLGILLQAEGQRPQARRLLKDAVETLWRYRAVRQSQALGANENDRIRPIYNALIANYLATGDDVLALAAAEQLRAASVRFDVSERADTRLRRPAEADTVALAAARDKMFRALQAREKKPSAQNEQAAAASLDELDLAMTRFELAAEKGSGTDTSFPVLLSKLQAALGNRALLLYHKTEDDWILFAVTSDAKRVLRLAVPPTELAKRIAVFREFAWDDGTVPPELGWLHQQLIAPVLALVGGRDLVVVPSAELNLLPFAALHDGQAYLGQARIVTTALGIGQALQVLNEKRRSTAGPAVLLSAAGPAGADPLLHADEEVDAAAQRLPDASIIKDAGTADYHGKVADAAIVHLAVHAVADTGHPLLSRILLMPKGGNDGYLSIADIRRRHLRRQPLVVLSGCETSIGTVGSDETVRNLASAFLEAGAGAVVSSLWRVDDASTAFFMEELYRALAVGAAPALALHQAMRASMARYPHPFYWAAFAYIGPP
jgi:CHAT domain-containing protein/tetratricopeptide (TPR) repeat protein